MIVVVRMLASRILALIPLLLGVILCSAVTVIIANLLVDLAYGKLDPRVRAGR